MFGSRLITREIDLSEDDQNVLQLRLEAFYQNVPDYTVFKDVSRQDNCWIHLKKIIEQKSENEMAQKVQILEVGAGMSGFGDWLQENGLREKVDWSVQDITNQNLKWLAQKADNIYNCQIENIECDKRYDIIFSTYVLEHVSNPNGHLNEIWKRLKVTGSLFLFCPRYDFPGYMCPSAKHLSKLAQIGVLMAVLSFRVKTLLYRTPAFILQTDLAAFHKPFYRDSDALHWVSIQDLKLWSQSKNAIFKRLSLAKSWRMPKDWFVKTALTCAVQILKTKKI